MKKLRVGVVGLGHRGQNITSQLFMKMDFVSVTHICDLRQDRIDKMLDTMKEANYPLPVATQDYKEFINPDTVDCVIVSTCWRSHVKVVLYAMRAGVPVGSEVGPANCLEDCFELVRTWEETKTPYMFCENCNYGEKELGVLNMVKKGLFGEIVHCEGAYGHDLRAEVSGGQNYRLKEYLNYNRENYPSHELGPIMNVLDINRSNRLISLSSFSSKTRGINDWAARNEWAKENAPTAKSAKFTQGDVITTVITCQNGETILLSLDTTLPRPYSRRFTVRGTKGMYVEDNNSVYLDIEEHTKEHSNWKALWGNGDEYMKEYAHPLWTSITEEEKNAGHGGMDYLCYKDFFMHVISGEPMPIDVYDAATIMCISPLSEISIKSGGLPVAIPYFKKD